jgi:formamidopyrimidine-DNA glycosylase
MLEIPESHNVAKQLNQTIKGKVIRKVLANASPHRFAFYFGDPDNYHSLLSGKAIGEARAVAGFIEIEAEDARILFNDGVNIRYYPAGEPVPAKNQLHIEFEDNSSIVCTVQMYGGLWVYHAGENDNKYYLIAREKPSPLIDEFNEDHFRQLLDGVKKNLSAKAFLATEQRIPGLGNGVLQDILFNAKINPRRPLEKLTDDEKYKLFKSVKQTLLKMTAAGGRDTEKDIFGCSGRYETVMSKRTLSRPCPVCGGAIVRQAYLGGNVYFCPACQPLDNKAKGV